jgi:lipid-A-disaccharide synthase
LIDSVTDPHSNLTKSLFISAGEPSGDLHGANFVRVLKQTFQDISIVGFGGPKMADAGQQQHYRLTELAIMGFGQIPTKLPQFLRLGQRAEVFFRSQKPSALILIDFPGFNLAIAKRAHRVGVPVYYFVPPQYWAWWGQRANKLKCWVRTTLTTLPFEHEWFQSRGINSAYIGHPYFDELHQQKLDADFLKVQKQTSGPIVGLLPGSRNQEVNLNSDTQLSAARIIQQSCPGVRFLVAAFNDKQAEMVRAKLQGSGLRAEVLVGKTPEVIEASTVCVTVSGSVSLELLYRCKPSVIVYRISRFVEFLKPRLLTVPYITLVNILAKQELFPEVVGTSPSSEQLAQPVIHWLRDSSLRQQCVEKLAKLKQQVAQPGACQRAAEYIQNDLKQLNRIPY